MPKKYKKASLHIAGLSGGPVAYKCYIPFTVFVSFSTFNLAWWLVKSEN